jgi:hypothetical protein
MIDERVTLRELTEENRPEVLALRVAPSEVRFVSPQGEVVLRLALGPR